MLIEKLNFNLMDAPRDSIILHGTNCNHGFGSGVAAAVKERYSEVYKAFKALPPCPELLGTIQIVKLEERNPPCAAFVINGFTQVNYGYDGKKYASVEAIEEVLSKTIAFCSKYGFNIYMPRIGCLRGGLSWDYEVKPIVQAAAEVAQLEGIDITVCTL